MKGFRDLKCWKQANSFRMECYDLTRNFPEEEKYRLNDQLIRSSRGVGNAIAEGYGRFHYQENIQFCRIARGSLEESLDHLIIARSCQYLSNEEFNKMEEYYKEVLRLLNGYISYLSRQKQNHRSTNPPISNSTNLPS